MKPLDIEFLKIIDALDLRGQKLLLACSGGMDSICLLRLLSKAVSRRNLQIEVVYIHHGTGSNKRYRDLAAEFVKVQCEYLGFVFHKIIVAPSSESEESLRSERRRWILDLKNNAGFNAVLMAHHRDDLMESRIMRLVRGVGPNGFAAMKLKSKEGIVRPLLQFSRSELKEYAESEGFNWLEDPSNQDLGPFRNWLRNFWLPQLEIKNPGALNRLTKSLELLSELHAVDENSNERVFLDTGLDRVQLMGMSKSRQRSVVAGYFQHLGLKNYTTQHVEEILKRVDTPKKELRFRMLKRTWVVDTWHIKVLEP